MLTNAVIHNSVQGVVTFSTLAGQELFSFSNQLQYDWAVIASKCIGFGDRSYRVQGMYVEYENVTLPGDVVTVPTFTRDVGLSYYTGLSGSLVRDYLRLPLAALPKPGVRTGYTSYFGTDPEIGNELDFIAITDGVAGVHAKPFTVGVNSKIFGVGLVATPSWADATQDLIFARAYVPTGDQLVVPNGTQIAITWKTSFL